LESLLEPVVENRESESTPDREVAANALFVEDVVEDMENISVPKDDNSF
jgi:hypothetical protein